MDAKDPLVGGLPIASAKDAGKAAEGGKGETRTISDAEMQGLETRIEQAETRAEHAEARTEEAKTRTEQAEIRIEQAETRTEQAERRSEQAETRTEQAKTRIEQAESKVEQADTRSELAISASELSYRRLFEAAKDGILILAADSGLISDANPFLVELLGFNHSELVGKPVWELGPFKDVLSNRNKFEELQKLEYVRYDNLPLETRDGRKIAVEFISNVYCVGERRVIQCNIRDITERAIADKHILDLNEELKLRVAESERLGAQFIEAQKMEVIGQLIGGVAHDFNNILGVIMGYNDLITSDLGSESQFQNYTEEIRHALGRATGLTRQLLIFSRKQVVQTVVLDLGDAVSRLDPMLRRLISENIEMTIVPDAQTGRIRADSGYIGQVLMNLVINARDAMPNGGKLAVTTSNVIVGEQSSESSSHSVPRDYVMLSVADTGTGMTNEVRKHLFEAFFTTKPVGKGTGLGLSTCHNIVQQSGGYIDVQSELGKGTTFQIYFPRVDEAVDIVTEPIQTGGLPRGTETLLLVEDDPSVRHLARNVLETQGYEVLVASNGQDALHVANDHKGAPIRLVVTDVIMPVMGGKVMAEWLKASFPNLKVLFTSGYTDDAISHYGALETEVEFLPKPYSTATLIRKVRELLDKPVESEGEVQKGNNLESSATP